MTLDDAAKLIDPDAFYDGLKEDGLATYWHARRAQARRKASAVVEMVREELPSRIDVYRAIKLSGVRRHTDIALVVAQMLGTKEERQGASGS